MAAELYGLTEFAKRLGKNSDPHKLSVYYRRGKLPEPSAFAGINRARPLWTEEQIEKFIQNGK